MVQQKSLQDYEADLVVGGVGALFGQHVCEHGVFVSGDLPCLRAEFGVGE